VKYTIYFTQSPQSFTQRKRKEIILILNSSWVVKPASPEAGRVAIKKNRHSEV